MTDKLTPAEVDAFLTDLTELTRRHGIEIGGCGCCGSPWLDRAMSATGRYEVNDSRSGQMWDGLKFEFEKGEQSS